MIKKVDWDTGFFKLEASKESSMSREDVLSRNEDAIGFFANGDGKTSILRGFLTSFLRNTCISPLVVFGIKITVQKEIIRNKKKLSIWK